MQQESSDSSETSRHVITDIAHAERLLLHHAEAASKANGDVALVQHAQRLIIYLQQHAQTSQDVLATAKYENVQAQPARLSFPMSEAALDASATALRTVFDGNLLSELCTILHSLYVRQACLDASPASLTAPVHADNHDLVPAPAHCKKAAGSMHLDVSSVASAPGKSAQHQQHNELPHCLAAAPESPQQHIDAQEQAPVGFNETAALRCGDFPPYCPHSLCTTWQKLSAQHVTDDLT